MAQNLNNPRPNISQSVRTSNRQQENYNQTEFTSKYIKRSEINNTYGADSKADQNNAYEHNYYPETYVQIDNGFRKFKTNQIIALQELRQEYEILKSLPIDEKLHRNHHKNSDSASSSVHADSRSVTTNKSKVKKDHTAREVQLLSLEKKQLEIVINNSMKKIQDLLHQQTEFKKQIHILKNQLQDKSGDEKYQSVIKNLKRNQAEYQQTIDALKRDQQRLKGIISQLNEKISRLESEYNNKEQQLRHQYNEKRRLDDAFRSEKDKYLTLEIQCKRLRMEYQILQKQKQSQIRRLIKDSSRGLEESSTNERVKALQQQVQLKDKRYHLLLDQLNTFSSGQKGQHNQQQLKTLFESLLAAQGQSLSNSSHQATRDLNEKISELVNENRRLNQQIRRVQLQPLQFNTNSSNEIFISTIQTLLQKFTNSDRSLNNGLDESLKRELMTLKNQVQDLKVAPEIQKKLREQHQTIYQLNKIIEDENLEKVKFMEQLAIIKREYQNMFDSNDSISKKLGLTLQRQMHYKQQIQILKSEMEALISTKGDLTASKTQNFNLKMRVIEMQRLQQQVEKLRQQNQNLREKIKRKQDQYEEEIRVIKRKFNQTDFQVGRAKKQGQLNVELLQKDYLSETSRYKFQAQKNNEERIKLQKRIENICEEHSHRLKELSDQNQRTKLIYENRLRQKSLEIQQFRMKYEQRIITKNTEMDNWKQPFQERLQSKDKQLQNLRKQNDLQIAGIMNRHEQQMATILRRVEALNEANEKFMKKNQWYLELQREVQELRLKIRHCKHMNDAVDHLWQVKQAEYSNIHEIIRQMKKFVTLDQGRQLKKP